MPMLAVTSSVLPSTSTGRATAASNFCAMVLKFSVCRMSGIRMTNSSPPTRATVSTSRTSRVRRSARLCRKWSPTSVPCVVVNIFKRVKTEIRGRAPPILAPRLRELLLKPLHETHTVGQVGQRVLVGLRHDPGLRALAVGDVEEGAEHRRPPLELGGRRVGFYLDSLSVLAHRREGVVNRLQLPFESLPDVVPDGRLVLCHDEIQCRFQTQQLLRRVAEDRSELRVDVAIPAVLDQAEPDRGFLDERTKPDFR